MNRIWQDSFRAMGTTCSIAVSARPSELRRAQNALAVARAEVAACERALSRFDPASDLSRLNGAGGEWIEIDRRLADALTAAVRARRETDGRFDPTILPALVAAGYDRTFEELEPRAARPLRGWRAGALVEVDAARRRARVGVGAAVDLGGIGKGFSAERVLDAMRSAWPELPGALVDLGGDVAVGGIPPEGGSWRIAVADPRRPGTTLGVLRLEGGGVATSGRDVRRFGLHGELHHLIDPATGASAVDGPLAVTVVAADPAEAEANATALGIMPVADAASYVAARPRLAALVVPHVGDVLALGPLPLESPLEMAAA
jgi:FAD:protein FMN transferase